MATRNAASPNRTDVAAAYALAADGDTVAIPAGTGTGWTTKLSIAKAITVQGNGGGTTVITDDITGTNPIFDITLVAAKTTRITGLKFSVGTHTVLAQTDAVKITGSNTDGSQYRVDNNIFEDVHYRAQVGIFGGAVGVTDHNTSNVGTFFGYVDHSTWDGGTNGDKAWTAATDFGTSKFAFFEQNTLTRVSLYEVMDSLDGARWVFRYNAVTNGRLVQHGTDSGGRSRGNRAVEVYNNTFTSLLGDTELFEIRSGPVLIHDNTYTGYGSGARQVGTLKAFRLADTFSSFGGADGTNQADTNLAGGPFTSGTTTTTGALTLTDSTKSWTINQWVGYSLKNTTLGNFGVITSNTATTITVAGSAFGHNFSSGSGNSYQVWKVTAALDQPGMGVSGLLSGNVSYPGGWPDQAIDPCYEWNNTTNGVASSGMGTGYASIVSGTHFINGTAKPGYTAYTYPHPLVGDTTPPSIPTGVTVT